MRPNAKLLLGGRRHAGVADHCCIAEAGCVACGLNVEQGSSLKTCEIAASVMGSEHPAKMFSGLHSDHKHL